MTLAGRPKAKAFAKNVFINQERKSEIRSRSDTAVVLTVNHTGWLPAAVFPENGLGGRPMGSQSNWVPGVVWLQS